MKVKIKEQDLDLHFSARIFVLYEQMTEKPIEPDDFKWQTNLLALLYCTIIATLQWMRLPASLEWQDFMDWFDEQPQGFMDEFGLWFAGTMQGQKIIEPAKSKKKKDDLPSSKKK